MDDGRIVQKDEIAVIRKALRAIGHTRERNLTLLSDCLPRARLPELRNPQEVLP
jgi:hypothetical protein